MSTITNPNINLSLGSFGSISTDIALLIATQCAFNDPVLGAIGGADIQLCPQNRGYITEDNVLRWRSQYPQYRFRLHANVRMTPSQPIFNLVDYPECHQLFDEIGRLSQLLSAPVYSAHAGKRRHRNEAQVIRFSEELTQNLGLPVAIEGHYPTAGVPYLFDSWKGYQLLLESNAYFAVDLSHLNIIAAKTGQIESMLTAELLACDRCVEIHLSANNGERDEHLQLSCAPWWLSLLSHRNSSATLFYEGRLSR